MTGTAGPRKWIGSTGDRWPVTGRRRGDPAHGGKGQPAPASFPGAPNVADASAAVGARLLKARQGPI